MDRGAWRATVQRVAQSRTQLKRLSTHAHIYPLFFRYPSHLGHHRTLSRVPCVTQRLPASYLFYILNLNWKYVLKQILLLLSCFSCVRLCATLWIVARQAPLSMGFSRQEYWSGLPCPPPGDLPNPKIEQRLNPDLLHCRQILYYLSHEGVYGNPASWFIPPSPSPFITISLFYKSVNLFVL